MASEWSQGLPAHVIALILGRLAVGDYIRSAAVCTSWRQSAAENPHRRAEIPWLMLPGGCGEDDNGGLSIFFSIAENKFYKFHLPQIRGRRCIGSSDGWIVTMDDFRPPSMDYLSEIHLLNPLTGAEIRLPPIIFSSFIAKVERDGDGRISRYSYWTLVPNIDYRPLLENMEYTRHYTFIKVIFSPSASVAVAIHGEERVLSFARVGDDSWTQIPSAKYFDDVIFHKGQFYAVTDQGLLTAFDPGNNNSSSPPKMTFIGGQTFGPVLFTHYLVESPDGVDLLLVRRVLNRDYDSLRQLRTTSFKIFGLDPSNLQWVEVNCLGKNALFLGRNRSMLFSTKDSRELNGNCIYFTEDDDALYVVKPETIRDMGVFNLEDGSVEADSRLNGRDWPPPFWIMPTLS